MYFLSESLGQRLLFFFVRIFTRLFWFMCLFVGLHAPALAGQCCSTPFGGVESERLSHVRARAMRVGAGTNPGVVTVPDAVRTFVDQMVEARNMANQAVDASTILQEFRISHNVATMLAQVISHAQPGLSRYLTYQDNLTLYSRFANRLSVEAASIGRGFLNWPERDDVTIRPTLLNLENLYDDQGLPRSNQDLRGEMGFQHRMWRWIRDSESTIHFFDQLIQETQNLPPGVLMQQRREILPGTLSDEDLRWWDFTAPDLGMFVTHLFHHNYQVMFARALMGYRFTTNYAPTTQEYSIDTVQIFRESFQLINVDRSADVSMFVRSLMRERNFYASDQGRAELATFRAWLPFASRYWRGERY